MSDVEKQSKKYQSRVPTAPPGNEYDWEQAANVAISDSKGIISYVKDKFCEL
ncbi:MAG: hypothetical protein EBE86_020995 [Hormoscilla sp. GUM202]|nr:hypothetical protein [Hormoscilla sp. GUM202]